MKITRNKWIAIIIIAFCVIIGASAYLPSLAIRYTAERLVGANFPWSVSDVKLIFHHLQHEPYSVGYVRLRFPPEKLQEVITALHLSPPKEGTAGLGVPTKFVRIKKPTWWNPPESQNQHHEYDRYYDHGNGFVIAVWDGTYLYVYKNGEKLTKSFGIFP